MQNLFNHCLNSRKSIKSIKSILQKWLLEK